MRRRIPIQIVLSVVTPLVVTTAAAQEIPRGAALAPEFRLKGDVVSVPFVMVREFPFVEAEVNGIKGKLLLDTGAEEALSLNHNHIKLPAGRVIGRGNFGSGQTFEMVLRPSIDSVRLSNGQTYGRITTVRSQDAAQLERITPDFLGWLGYSFWDGYVVKFDYKASKATFYKGGSKTFLKGETVVAVMTFATPKLPNDPVLTAKIGDTDFATVLDTGQYGAIFADNATLERLKAAGAIKATAGDSDAIDVVALQFNSGPSVALARIPTHPIEASAPFAKAVGIVSPRILTLGYAFLHQYKTVLDYPNKTLYLLRR